jgi:thiol-disulfide isomerase/thioredoxin
MSPLILLLAAGVLALMGGVLLAVLLRAGKPHDALGWGGYGLAAALFAVASILTLLARGPDVPPRPPASALVPPAALRDTERGQPAPDFQYRPLGGGTERLSDLRGRVVLVNLWATWCAPCLRELPDLSRLQQRYEGLGLTVLTLSAEDEATVRAFVETTPLATTVGLVSPDAPLPDPYARLGEFLPSSFFIDRSGVLLDAHVGALRYEDLEQRLAGLLQPTLAAR